MTVGMRSSVCALVLVCVVLAARGEVNGESPADQPQYPSTGFPPWTPASGIPPIVEKRKPDTDRLLLEASNALQADGRDGEALTVLMMVLEGKNEPTDRLSYADNSKHAACKKLSDIHERRGELSKALEFAMMARDKYPYSDWCGVMAMSVQMEADRRVASLGEQFYGNAPQPMSGSSESRSPAANRPSMRR